MNQNYWKGGLLIEDMKSLKFWRLYLTPGSLADNDCFARTEFDAESSWKSIWIELKLGLFCRPKSKKHQHFFYILVEQTTLMFWREMVKILEHLSWVQQLSICFYYWLNSPQDESFWIMNLTPTKELRSDYVKKALKNFSQNASNGKIMKETILGLTIRRTSIHI